LGFSNDFSCNILLALRELRLWINFTDFPNFVKNVASSRAVSQPPTTAISSPLKKGPSQVAQ
jgi:hypothetical protein